MAEQKDACGEVWYDGQITNTGSTILTLNDVVFTGESFFAVGNNGVAYKSDDGKSWGKPLNTTLKQEEHLFGIAFGSGELVAVGRDQLVLTSSDNGANWSLINHSQTNVEDLLKVTYGSSAFAAVGEFGNIWGTPTPGIWEQVCSPGGGYDGGRDICFGNGYFLMAAVSGKVYYTKTPYDGSSWKHVQVTTSNTNEEIIALYYDAVSGLWAAAGRGIWITKDITNWGKPVFTATSDQMQLHCTAASSSRWVAGGNDGLIMCSTDISGQKWDNGTTYPFKDLLFGLGYGKSVMAAVGDSTHAQQSTHYTVSG